MTAKAEEKRKEEKFSEIYEYHPLSKYEGLRGKFQCRAPTTYVGVEVELEKVQLKTNPPSSWKTVTDGSLKLDGKEFITVPIRFCYLEQELVRLFGSMKPPHVSSRCSIHVHMNARDFTQQELLRFVLLYLIFEKSLFNFSGGRSANIFCTPLYESIPIVAAQLSKLQKGDGFIKFVRWNKYFALNICPIWGQQEESKRTGTIEFRHMAGTTDVEHIIEWVNLIVSLKIAAKKLSTDSLITNLLTMNSTSSYDNLVDVVFKEWAVHLTEQETFKEDVEHGVMVAKEALSLKTKDVEISIPFTNRRNK
jgi:hypothetical protein